MTSDPEKARDEPSSSEPDSPRSFSADDVASVSSSGPSVARPWGPWATVGWTLLCLAVLAVAQVAVLIVFAVVRVARGPAIEPDGVGAIGEELATNGNLLAAATLASTTTVLGLVLLLVRIRGYPVREYLALSWPGWPALFLAIGGLAALLVASDLTSYSLGRPLVPEIMQQVYQHAWLPFLVLAVVILAPLTEETLFRGFLYKGIASSRAGPATAIVVSAIMFSVIHIQYDWYGMLTVAVMGFYLGVVRYRFSSMPLTMVLHAIANAVATAEVFVISHGPA
jgi:membrane protease YdiL (CAAX protease family)